MTQIRTVAAYNGESRALAMYDSHLDGPQQIGKKQGLVGGFAIGMMQFTMFCSYGVALLYGAFRVSQGVYTGGEVLSVVVASLLGSFSLGLAGEGVREVVTNWGAGFPSSVTCCLDRLDCFCAAVVVVVVVVVAMHGGKGKQEVR